MALGYIAWLFSSFMLMMLLPSMINLTLPSSGGEQDQNGVRFQVRILVFGCCTIYFVLAVTTEAIKRRVTIRGSLVYQAILLVVVYLGSCSFSIATIMISDHSVMNFHVAKFVYNVVTISTWISFIFGFFLELGFDLGVTTLLLANVLQWASICARLSSSYIDGLSVYKGPIFVGIMIIARRMIIQRLRSYQDTIKAFPFTKFPFLWTS